MADFPWEDFQTNSTATVEKGPWEDFAAQKPRFKKTRAQVTAEVEKAQAARPVEQMSGLESVAAGTYEPARWASLQPVVQGLENVLAVPINDFMSQAYGPQRPPFVIDRNAGTLTQAEGTVPHYVPGTPLVNLPLAHPEQDGSRQVSPLPRAVSQVVEGLMTPGNLALLSAGGTRVGQQGLATVFGPQMAVGAVEETGQALNPELPVDERQTAAYRAAINAVMAGLSAKSLTDGMRNRPPAVLEPEVLPPLAPRQYSAPVGRQLPAPEPLTIDVAPPTQLPLTTATTLAERNNPQPFSQIIRSQEPIDPITMKLGRERDPIITPQPEDLRTIVRQSVEEAMGRLISNEKRPSQESPVVLGGQQTQAPMVYGPRPVPLDVKVEEGRAFTPKAEVEGGKISFAAPAEQGAIPSARQAAIPEYPESRLATKQDQPAPAPVEKYNYRLDPDAVSKMGPAEFKEKMSSFTNDALELGDKVKGNSEAIAKLEQQQAAATAEFKQAMQEGRMDDAMILSTKPQYFREALEIAKGTAPESANKKLEELKGMRVKEAVEKNKESGSIANPFEFLRERFKKKEDELRGDFALDGPRYLLDPKVSGFNNPTREVDSNQLWNRLKNKLNPAETDVYEKNGVADKIRKMGKVTPQQAAEMLQEAGPQVQVHSYGMEGKVSEAKREYDTLSHTFYDNLTQLKKKEIDDIWYRAYQAQDDISSFMRELSEKGFTKEEQANAKRYFELGVQLRRDGGAGIEGPRAASAYETVSAFDTKEPMPEWTKSKEGKNVQRVDVVIPAGDVSKKYLNWLRNNKRQDNEAARKVWNEDVKHGQILWQPDNLHENLPNTLGWAMIQYKTGPKGEKIAVIAEAQSRWGQARREWEKKPETENNAEWSKKDLEVINHPLLRDYNRLILKAAIDQARKEGATHIVVSDSKSTMLSEGIDGDTLRNGVYDTQEAAARKAEQLTSGNDKYKPYRHGDKWYVSNKQGGYDLNYDTILPKIAEELTGSKGERVSLGEHKNALAENTHESVQREIRRLSELRDSGEISGQEFLNRRNELMDNPNLLAKTPRPNLIFKNPDGSTKTDVSGLMYPIDKVPTQKASLFEKDRPETRSTKLYGGAFFFDPDFWRDTFRKGNGGKQERVVGGLQKLDSYEKEFTRANRIQGSGKLGKSIGGFLDPRRKALGNDVAQALVAWHSQTDTGRKMATLWAESRKRLGDITADSKDGKITLANGQRDFMGDVFEREIDKPGSQPLTPLQRQAVEFAKRVFKDTGLELSKENVKGFLESDKDSIDLSQPYFPRPAIGKVDKKMDSAVTKRAVGSERFFQKGRKFPTEKMGYENGIRYEPSFYGRIVTYLENYYRAIADERLATHLEKLSESEHKFMENALTYHPAFRGRYFSNEGHQAITRSLDRPSHQIEKIAGVVQDYKKFRFTADVSYLFNQLLPTLVINPVGWGTAAKQGFKALVNDKALSEYLSKPENLKAAQRIVQNGGGIGNLWEFIGGAEREGVIDKIRPIKASGRAMQVALDTAKVELYKALEPMMKKQGWSEADLVEAIGNAVYSAPAKGIGVSDTRAIVEKLTFNAPNYLRATANMLASLGTEGAKNTPAGYVARRAIVGLGAAIMIQFAVLYTAMVKLGQMDEDEMKDRLNPTKPQFLKLPVKVPMGKDGGLEGSADDKVVEMSYGNILLSIARAVGGLGAIATGDKEGSVFGPDNPGIRFVSNRLSPWWNVVSKIITGENFKGQKEPAIELLSEELLPIVLNPVLEEGFTKAGGLAAGGSAIGLSTSVESRSARQKRLEKEYAQQTYKMPVSRLNVAQRRNTALKAEQALAGEEKEGPSLYSLEAPQKRAEKVMGLLSNESRAMLEQAKLKVPNIIATQTEDKKPLKLNNEEQDFYIETYAKELDRRLSNIKRSESEVNKKRFESITQSVGEYSWTQTKRLINTRAREESRK